MKLDLSAAVWTAVISIVVSVVTTIITTLIINRINKGHARAEREEAVAARRLDRDINVQRFGKDEESRFGRWHGFVTAINPFWIDFLADKTPVVRDWPELRLLELGFEEEDGYGGVRTKDIPLLKRKVDDARLNRSWLVFLAPDYAPNSLKLMNESVPCTAEEAVLFQLLPV